MTARFRPRTLLAIAAVCGWLTAEVAFAQVQVPAQQQRRPQTQERIGQPVNQANTTDAQLVACLLIDNHNEVAISRLAQQRSENDDVKKFATQMVEDHSKFIDLLRPMAGKYADIDTAEANAATNGRTSTPQPAHGGPIDLVELKQQLGRKCLESTRKELEKKEGAKFDHCYMGQQVMAHMVVLDTLEVFQQYASPELLPVLKEGITTTKQHLEHAKKLAESVKDKHATAQASRDDGSRKE